jgi:subtilisin family serine protease
MKRFLFSGALSAGLLVAVLAALASAPASPPVTPSSAGYASGRIIVKLKPTLPTTDAAQVRSAFSAHVETRFSRIGTEVWDIGNVPVSEAVEKLRRDPRVEFAEPDYLVHATAVYPNDPQFSQQWSLHNSGRPSGKADADIDAPEAWTATPGAPVLIGVIDSGVEMDHEDLAGAIYTNPGEIPGNNFDDDGNGYADDVHGWDFRNGDNDPDDDNGHGTHVSGLIAAPGNNGKGVAGVCWSARVLPLKFLSAAGAGATSDAIAAIQYAIRMGVKVINASWGSFLYSNALRDAVADAADHGVLIIASSGNDTADTDLYPTYPAGYDLPNVIAVTSTDRNDGLAWFSDYGRNTVDIAAPGFDIVGTFPGNRYVRLYGTSMSTALVSGAACLLWSRAPFMTDLDMKAALFASVDKIPSLEGRMTTGGRINLQRLMSTIDTMPPAPVTSLSVQSAASNAVTLAWLASGDDGAVGKASRYEVRYSTKPITASNFNGATLALNPLPPRATGSAESFQVPGLFFLTKYYFALVVIDKAGNRSPVSNAVSTTTLGVPHLDLSADTFDANLATGATQTRLLTITNSGDGTLDFSTPVAPAWAHLVPDVARVAAGQSIQVQVIFDAVHMTAGSYNSSVLLANNDPTRSNAPLTVGLQVASAPDISVSAATLDLGTTFPLVCANKTIKITNQGTAPLNVSGFAVAESPFVVTANGTILAPGESFDVPVYFCPSASGKVTGALSVQSNDPDHPSFAVTLLGKCVEPPAVSAGPQSLAVTLNPGATATRTLSIHNAGGSNLDYVVSIVAPGSTTQTETIGATPAGAAAGVARPLSRDALQRARGLPSQVTVDANGHVDMNSPSVVQRSGTVVPPATTRNNRVVEVFGKDENLFSGSELMRGNVFSCTRTTNLKEFRFYLSPFVSTEIWFVVYTSETKTGLYELVGASILTSSATGPGWYSSGDINVHLLKNSYYMMAATFVDNTGYYLQKNITPYPIPTTFGSLLAGAGYTYAPYVVFPPFGFQLIPTTAYGQPVAYYQTVVTDGVIPWLSATGETGSVPRNQSTDIQVTFDATGLTAGDHQANVRITSNDPATPQVVIPVQVHVNNAGDIALPAGPVDIGECFVGVSAADTFMVTNKGTSALSVNGILTNNSLFTAKPTSLFLDPGEFAPVVITFKPKAEGAQTALFTFNSSDPDEASIALEVRAAGRRPPGISIPSQGLSENIPPGASRARTFTIVNTGDGPLTYELAFAKPKPAARAGRKIIPSYDRPARAAGTNSGRLYAGRSRVERTHVLAHGTAPADANGLKILSLRTGDAYEILDYLFSYSDIAVIEEFDAYVNVPTLEDLLPYDVVLVIHAGVYADPTVVGDVLADYVDAGGSVIMTLATFIEGYAMEGRFAAQHYSPFDLGTGPEGSALLGSFDADHPIMAEASIALGEVLGNTTVAPGAHWVADWNNGFPFIATSRGGQIVAMNVFFGDGQYWDGDIPLILHNTLLWVTGVRWLHAQPNHGVVGPHQTVTTKILFDTKEVGPGSYTALLRVTHNDPAATPIEIPVSLNVDSTLVASGAGELPTPARYALEPNRPNPFNPVTTIAYDLQSAGRSRLIVYDVSGAQVRTLVDASQPAGSYSVTWDGRDDSGRPAASGVYFYRLTSGTFAQTRKMVLLK